MKLFKKITLLLTIVLLAAVLMSNTNVKYVDGKYSATFNFVDGYGWKPQLTIIIKKGKITGVAMDYVNPQGKLKSKDKNYASIMKKKTGIAPAEAYKQLGNKMKKTQKTQVDTVSGATGTSKAFNEMAKAIFEKARKGDKSATVLEMDSTYNAKDKADERGYTGQIAVTYENNKIVKVFYDEMNNKKEGKRDSDYVNKEMEKASGISWINAVKKLEAQFLSTQDPQQVDTVTGATGLSARFKKLAAEAMNSRK